MTVTPRKLRVFAAKDLDKIPQLASLSSEQRLAMKAVSAVLPFRVNNYVCDELIDWSDIPADPIYQLTFPQPGMLRRDDFDRMYALVKADAPPDEIRVAARAIQATMNPHPAGQRDLNIPRVDGIALPGMQHKYRETVLFFPTQGQTCHAYCTYCFRWAQFVGLDELKFAHKEPGLLRRYVESCPEVSSVLFTGGDPMVMNARVFRPYIDALLDIPHLRSIRIGTKSPAYWPHRYVSDPDADEILRLFESVTKAGKNLALMAHFSHPRELETPIAEKAIQRIRQTGAVIRCQAPLIRHVNDRADDWAAMWKRQVRLGAVPYYMFVERDTGAKNYFEVPLANALTIFSDAYRGVSGLARTVRGPSMSTTPGKVLIDGIAEVAGERVFVLKFIQAREPSWVNRIFFAKYDATATWLDHLEPAFGEPEFFYEQQLGPMGTPSGRTGRSRYLPILEPEAAE